MSEERFDRLESQLTQVIQGMTVMQQNITNLDNKFNGFVTLVTTSFASLNERVDTVNTSLNSLTQQVNDINVDLTVNEQKTEDNARKTRRINQRLMTLEAGNEEI
jgi:chromosome segregation ATPase